VLALLIRTAAEGARNSLDMEMDNTFCWAFFVCGKENSRSKSNSNGLELICFVIRC